MFSVAPIKVAAPVVPVVVRVIAFCLPLNVAKSVALRYPSTKLVAAGIDTVPLVFTSGALKVSALCFPLNVFQSVELKNPLVETPDCNTCIDVPVPITAPVPPVMVRTAEVASVRFPFVSAGSLLLNVVQSVEDRAPLLVADAVGTFNVITGVVVPFATVLDKSVPVVPKVRAATLVTVPTN
jgi:hypothetical protein